jgi:hypothetical protein
MSPAGIKQDPFCSSGLPGIDMRDDTDVPKFLEWDY